MTDTVSLQIESCLEDPPAPQTVRYVGKAADGSEPVLLEVTLVDPGWGAWRKAMRRLNAAQAVDAGEHPDAVVIHAVLSAWSLNKPVTIENVADLHPAVFTDLVKRAMAILEVRAAQIKNSDAPSI